MINLLNFRTMDSHAAANDANVVTLQGPTTAAEPETNTPLVSKQLLAPPPPPQMTPPLLAPPTSEADDESIMSDESEDLLQVTNWKS